MHSSPAFRHSLLENIEIIIIIIIIITITTTYLVSPNLVDV